MQVLSIYLRFDRARYECELETSLILVNQACVCVCVCQGGPPAEPGHWVRASLV